MAFWNTAKLCLVAIRVMTASNISIQNMSIMNIWSYKSPKVLKTLASLWRKPLAHMQKVRVGYFIQFKCLCHWRGVPCYWSEQLSGPSPGTVKGGLQCCATCEPGRAFSCFFRADLGYDIFVSDKINKTVVVVVVVRVRHLLQEGPDIHTNGSIFQVIKFINMY